MSRTPQTFAEAAVLATCATLLTGVAAAALKFVLAVLNPN